MSKELEVEERAMKKARQAKITQVADMSMPLIDIDVDRIDKLIRSVIDAHFEDSIQEAWVRILDNHVCSEGDVLKIARDINRKAACKTISENHTIRRLDAPIHLHTDPFNKTFTLLDTLPSPPLIPFCTDDIPKFFRI